MTGSSRRKDAKGLWTGNAGRSGAIALCVGSAVGIAGLTIGGVLALLGGGYEPQDYAGTIDPVRAGLAVFLLTGAGLAGGVCVATAVGAQFAYRCGERLAAVESSGIALFWGITSVWSLAMAAYCVVGPAEAAPLPSPVRELTFAVVAGFAVLTAGGLLKIVGAVWRTRDRGGALALIALLLIAVWFAYQVLTR